MTLQLPDFPIDQPVMPEDRQIGRRVCIDKLENRLATPANQWLIGERRIGKTSVAKAALARLRKRGSVTIDLDLSKLQLTDAQALAGEIARQAQAAGAGDPTERFFRLVRKNRGRAKGLGKALADLGFRDEGEALAAVAAVLAEADDGAPGLERILGALALHAGATEQRVYLLLDEIHLLADLDDAPRRIAKWCREETLPIVFVFAGSEESAAATLREPGQPLAPVGEEFELTEIAVEDWIPGLGERFAAAGVKIERSELEAILAASRAHPRRTMLVASRVTASARMDPDRVATPTVVELAIREAERDRSWR